MNKRAFITILTAFCLVTLITTTIVAAKNKNDKKTSNSATIIEPDFYDIRMAKAVDQSQKDELNKLKNDKTHGVGWYKRDALMITNELPKDKKRLTFEEAENIIKDKNSPNDIVNSFNDIAGAPDWEGGLGMSRSFYYLDDKHSRAIVAFEGMYFVYIETDENGREKRIKNLGRDTLPAPSFSPEPSN